MKNESSEFEMKEDHDDEVSYTLLYVHILYTLNIYTLNIYRYDKIILRNSNLEDSNDGGII